ncbi:epoxide hydrolase family protein [Rhodococcoides navarretei]|uniref:Epoxide hydrolase family protein n=1 Tax=Rhodococcus navarretei TaxID=3128981 RepID=A0ABU9CZ46_9NOCA
MTITEAPIPFVVDVPQSELDDLARRVRDARLPEPLGADDWSTGVPISVLRSMATSWVDDFSWREVEKQLASFPQYVVEIDGQRIHYLHVRSSRADSTPVLLCHGWPGSYLEFLDLIPLLTEPDDVDLQAFDVIVPSVPGFAFSTPLSGDGWSIDRVAQAFVELMSCLGYGSYVVQGGDYGAGVAPAMGRLDPEHCDAIHVNGSIGAPFQEPDEEEQKRCTETELDRYRRVGEFMKSEFGYISIQSTRPQLIGAALTDSPIGQLSWMLDKFRAWTYPFDEEPDGALGRSRILAHVTLYWLTRSAGSAAHTVYAADGGAWGDPQAKPSQPVGAIMFAHDIGIRHLAEQEFDIVHWTEVPDHGGHFAAMEEPERLAADLRLFLSALPSGR